MEKNEDKLKSFYEKNIYPFGKKYIRTHTIQDLRKQFDIYLQDNNKLISIAGRIVGLRSHGKSTFVDIKDASDKIQLYAKSDVLKDDYSLFSQFDLGDIIGVEGTAFLTKRQEKTILVKKITLLAKALRQIPKEWYGLKDIETRYRKRYLDLILNDTVREVFIKRHKIINCIRKFLNDKGFIEVETPILQPLPGGASATPFVTHHIALNRDLYLRIAPELYLKRLIVGGFEKVYELSKSFRNEGISRKHNPEFTLLEAYQAYIDYFDMMDLVEEMISYVVDEVIGSRQIEYMGKVINFATPWQRIKLFDIIKKYTGMDEEQLSKLAEKNNMKKIDLIEDILDKDIGPKINEPCFIYDYPIESSPLARTKILNQIELTNIAERFELFIGGYEIANAYSELNDPLEQRRRFLAQDKERLDEDFLTALEYGLPPTAGLGVGIDRLVMILCNAASIRDVIIFPQLRSVEEGYGEEML